MELSIINKIYEVYRLIIDVNDSLTKRWRYSLGKELESSIMDFLEQLIMAKNAPKPLKGSYLIKAAAYLEISRLKLRLYLDLDLVKSTRVFQVQAKMDEVGRMLGGWRKANQST